MKTYVDKILGRSEWRLEFNDSDRNLLACIVMLDTKLIGIRRAGILLIHVCDFGERVGMVFERHAFPKTKLDTSCRGFARFFAFASDCDQLLENLLDKRFDGAMMIQADVDFA